MHDINNDYMDDFEGDDLQFCIITDDNFICGGCMNCNGGVITCDKFESRKPVSIFLNNFCAEFVPDNNE